MTLFSFLPHAHHWHNITISRQGAVSPGGRYRYSTYLEAECKRCGERIHKIYYRDISDEQARRWLG
ncbi:MULTISPECIES: hypothetical protein [unclassified Pantoea]|uniref:hypothetical protein n=1 Tax=unclassified Pantoea TaxID=2630326 RepID=UPI001E0523DD|nr:hypothetical protein [Pantoea sp. Pa-EAmG]MBK4769081.1 hypothetical protein [Pantoea sp. Morm]MDI6956432.1 hypothetical protein [Pantoea sp. Pa-EAmG]